MQVLVYPSVIKGEIQAPASKSSMQRACAAALLRQGETIIGNPGYSNDDRAALGVIQGLGAETGITGDGSIRVVSNGVHFLGSELNCGESGLSIRMFAPIMALSDQEIRVTGQGSLLKRPMDFFDTVFPQLDIRVVSNEGKLPLNIRGPLQPRDIEIDGSLSSQFLTGLLMAYAAAGASGVTIKVNDLKSKPYIDLTLDVMERFGWKVENRNYEEFFFAGTKVQRPETLDYTVEGDWSGSAFLLVAAAIAGRMRINGLDVLSTQADKAILGALEDCGAFLHIGQGAIEISSPRGPLKAFRFDATDCPDLFPPLVALAVYCQGETLIDGVDRLAHKESNRGLTLREEFGKLGVEIELEGDRMIIHGGGAIKGAEVHSRHDHRIAMACAVAGLRAEGATIISEAEAIDKSYPDFYDHLRKLGAMVKEQKFLV